MSLDRPVPRRHTDLRRPALTGGVVVAAWARHRPMPDRNHLRLEHGRAVNADAAFDRDRPALTPVVYGRHFRGPGGATHRVAEVPA